MKLWKKKFKPLLCLLGILLFATCHKEDNIVLVNPTDILELLTQADKVDPPAVKDEILSTWTEDKDGYRYTYEKHDVIENLENVTYLGLNDDVIWPGNLVKGNHVQDFVYEPISVDRAPITLSLNLESSSTGSSLYHEVTNPKLSTIRQGISDLLKKAIVADTKVPAKADFRVQQVFSQSQMNLAIGADLSYAGASFSSQFNWDEGNTSTKIMAKYWQLYYSVDIDIPQTPAGFFDPDVTMDELKTAIPPGSMPLYVAGVNYGMMAIMCIETNLSYSLMSTALDMAYHGADLDAEVDFGYTANEILQSASYTIMVYGGSTAGLNDLETNIDGFKKVINASTEFSSDSPGVPLVYKFRHLIDNTLAYVTLTSQYTLVKPLQMYQEVLINVEKFTCIMADDEGSTNTVDMDRFKVWAYAYDRTGPNDSGVQNNTGNELIYEYSGGEIDMDAGMIHLVNKTGTVAFNTDEFDFDYAKLKLKAYVRDNDDPVTIFNHHEESWAELDLTGHQIWGGHEIYLNSSDFTFLLTITITKGN
ncbi:MAG: thiol-activated cytolysin family protein [Phaeodactylibacter sp.]|nr:thiol-activated cytolysin family protein [Phaeodactylibacter sp.]MCB9301762.1 thiol-activated cytolysin family protein [Lewinellaceae bacterium]